MCIRDRHCAVYGKNEKALRVLVARDDIDMTVKNDSGDTAKEHAAGQVKHGLVAIMEEAEMGNKKKAEELEEVKAPAEEEVGQELFRGVAAMAGSEDFSDFTIICQGQEIRCNRLVIGAMSEVGLQLKVT